MDNFIVVARVITTELFILEVEKWVINMAAKTMSEQVNSYQQITTSKAIYCHSSASLLSFLHYITLLFCISVMFFNAFIFIYIYCNTCVTDPCIIKGSLNLTWLDKGLTKKQDLTNSKCSKIKAIKQETDLKTYPVIRSSLLPTFGTRFTPPCIGQSYTHRLVYTIHCHRTTGWNPTLKKLC